MMDKLDNRISSNSDLCTVLSNLNCEVRINTYFGS